MQYQCLRVHLSASVCEMRAQVIQSFKALRKTWERDWFSEELDMAGNDSDVALVQCYDRVGWRPCHESSESDKDTEPATDEEGMRAGKTEA